MVEIPKFINPFPGLRPFESTENHLFFGRDDQSHQLLRKLRRNRFVAVVGTSGSGKSSLVRAGLLPALYGGFMTQAGSSWRVAIFRPGHDPIGNLAHALNKPEVFGNKKRDIFDQASIIESTLHRSDLGLIEATRQARLKSHENLLIVVDQFEELFRFKQTSENEQKGDQASAFVTLLLEAAKGKTLPIYVVLTMRSDFLGDCSQFRDLPETINEGQYLIPRMTRAQRQAAITGPIAVGGGDTTPRLVQKLLNDVGDNPDQLPILQHALMRTWAHWSRVKLDSEPIDYNHYHDIGSMNNALSLHADEAYIELPNDHSKKLAEILFKTVSERGPDNREIRRPTRLGQICAIADANEEEMRVVIDTFRSPGRSFLMPPAGFPLSYDTLIDVSHESLIRNWELLKKWVDEESQSALLYRRLAETAELYDKGEAGYWRDPDLQIALNWREQSYPNESWGQLYHPNYTSAIKFLEESKTNRDAEILKIEAAQQKELRQAKVLAKEQGKAAKRLRFAFILSTILLLAVVIIVVAFIQRQSAVKEAKVSDTERLRAEQDKVRSDSSARVFAALFREADSLKGVATIFAEAERNARLEVDRQRQLAEASRDSTAIERENAIKQAGLAEMQKNEAIAARETALKSQRQLLAVALTIKSDRLRQQGENTLSALLAHESYRFDELSGGQFRNEIYDALRKSLKVLAPNRGIPTILQAPTNIIRATVFDPKHNKIVVGGADGTVQLLDLNQSSQPITLGKHIGAVTTTVLNSNRNLIATGGADLLIKLWEPSKNSQSAVELKGHKNQIWSMAFNPSGVGLVSGSTDGMVRYWDLKNNYVNKEIYSHRGNVLSMTFNPNGQILASSGSDNNVLLWNMQISHRPTILDTISFTTTPRALAFSPNSDLLVVGCEDGIIHLNWLPDDKTHILRGHQKRINSLAFSPSGNLLASGSSDKTIRLWNLHQLSADPIILSGHKSSVRTVTFSTTGDTLVAGTFGKEIFLWLTSPFILDNLVKDQVQRNLTLEEWHEYVGVDSKYPYGKLED